MRTSLIAAMLILPLLHASADADPPTDPVPPPPVAPAEEEVPIAGPAVLNWVIGFGFGHTLQRRWLERGWMFTAADTVGAGFIVYAIATSDCGLINILCSSKEPETKSKVALGVGLSVVVVSRVVAIIDAIHGGHAHNQRVRERRFTPYVVPTDGGTAAGLMLQF